MTKKLQQSPNIETKLEECQIELRRVRQELHQEQSKNRELSSALSVTQKLLEALKTKFSQHTPTKLEEQDWELGLYKTLSQHIGYSLSYEELFRSILQYLHSVITCDVTGIVLLEEESCELFFNTNRTLSLGARWEIQQLLLDNIAKINHKELSLPICFHALNPLSLESTGIKIEKLNSHCLLPIVGNNTATEKVTGLLYVGAEQAKTFTNEYVQVLSAISERASIYIEQLRATLEAQCNLVEKERISQALDRAKEINELKNRIIRIVSHEYRTPLTVISLATDLLETQYHKLSREHKQTCFRQIRSATQQMLQLVEDTTLVARAESEEISFHPVQIDVEILCRQLIDDFKLIDHKKHRLQFNYQGKNNPVYLDPKLVRQILNNLLSNAIKYSPEGGKINLQFTCDPHQITFTVTDSGIGIPSEDWDLLFDCFHRATNVGTLPGTGLGLTIVKKCVELHGGEINLRSQLNQGTTFIVKLPLEKKIT